MRERKEKESQKEIKERKTEKEIIKFELVYFGNEQN